MRRVGWSMSIAWALTLAACGSGDGADSSRLVDLGVGDDASTVAEAGVDASDRGAEDAVDGREVGSGRLCDAELERAAIGLASGRSEGSVSTTERGGVHRTTVEVPWENVDSKPYLYVRMLEGTSVPISDRQSLEAETWDLAIRGETVRLNGGVSGPASVRAAVLGGSSLQDVGPETTIDTFETDRLKSSCAPADRASNQLDTAIGEWWTGEGRTPADEVYVIERIGGDRIALEFAAFSASGSTATYELRWREIESESSCDQENKAREAIEAVEKVSEGSVTFSSGTAEIDASAGGRGNASSRPYTYVDLDAETKVEIDDVAGFDNQTWDLALERVVLRVNGGDSGSGGAKVAERRASDLGGVTEVPPSSAFETDDFVDAQCNVKTDRIGNPKTAIGTWYDYDVNSHALTPKDRVYVVQTTEGNHVKVKIQNYDDGVFRVAYAQMDGT